MRSLLTTLSPTPIPTIEELQTWIMAVKAVIPFLVGMMLLTGCANTLLTKFQDQQCVRNCDGKDGKPQNFEQPVIQT
jgi:hypothetical protein